MYLSKLNDVVKNEVVKKKEHGELVKKVNAIQTTDTSNLVKKIDYDTQISEIEKKLDYDDSNKYITTQEFNNLTSENCEARLKQANLASKSYMADFLIL